MIRLLKVNSVYTSSTHLCDPIISSSPIPLRLRKSGKAVPLNGEAGGGVYLMIEKLASSRSIVESQVHIIIEF